MTEGREEICPILGPGLRMVRLQTQLQLWSG